MDLIGILFQSGQACQLCETQGGLKDWTGASRVKQVQLVLKNPYGSESVRTKTKQLDDGKYECSYHVLAFDNLDVKIFGFGRTKQEAEMDCQNRVQRILAM